ncbi:uncharacterized protein [Diadema antillarum]|uniref:uncharacterized protein n=1 Tax=Diadema antillarum TaxID=105358 RepID=UPI003A866498
MDLTKDWRCVWTLVFLVTLFACVLSGDSGDLTRKRRRAACIQHVQMNDQPEYLSSETYRPIALKVSWTIFNNWQCRSTSGTWRTVHYKIASTDLCPRDRPSEWTEIQSTYRNSYQRHAYLYNLKPHTTYNVKVTLHIGRGLRESNTISFTTKAKPYAPGTIALNSITNTEGKQIRWGPVSPGNGFEAYEVQLVRNNLPETCINITNASNTAVTFHDALPCVHYVFRVRVRKSGQNFGLWQKKNIAFYDLKVNARHGSLSSEGARVSWTINPSCHYTYHTSLVHYRVASTDLCPRDSREWTNTTQNHYRNDQGSDLHGLRPLTAYEAKVTLWYQHGRRIESNTISFTTEPKSNAPGPIALNSITQPEGKQVHWARVWLGNRFEAYEIQLLLNDRPVTCIEINEAGNTTVTFHNALLCVRYVFRRSNSCSATKLEVSNPAYLRNMPIHLYRLVKVDPKVTDATCTGTDTLPT